MKKYIILFVLLNLMNNLFASDVLRTISVIGKGEMVIKPDTVVISTGVDSGDPIIGSALEQNNQIMSGIFEGLADLGIPEENIETNNYNVYLYRPYNESNNNQEEYRVSNSIRINIKKLELVDTVIDTLITLGANKISGIYFTFEDGENYQQELRVKAMVDARNKAEFLASLEDMKIVSVISIQEQGATTPLNSRNYEYDIASTMSKTNITSGMEKLSLIYNVIYQIEPK